MSSFRTDYLGHDHAYRKRRARGSSGWDEDPKSLAQTQSRMDEFLKDTGLPPGGTILEFGCGAGDLLLPWAQRGYQAAGVDIAPFAVEWAGEKARQMGLDVELFVADITKELNLPLSPVDLLIDGHCLHCIIGPDRPAFFRNARKYLKPGGRLHINTMCGDPPKKHFGDFDPVHRYIVINGIATRYFGNCPELLDEITEAGFRIEKHAVLGPDGENDTPCLLVNARPVT